jgi:hypothetical protein
MKSFVRDHEDGVLVGSVVAGLLVLAIANHLFGEVAFLPLALAGGVLCVSEFRRWRRARAKERSGAARSTGSR